MDAPISAYCGPAPTPEDLFTRWNDDPVLVGVFGGAIFAFLLFGARTRQARMAQAGALLLLAVAFLSPLCAMGATLFTANAISQVLLGALVGPLLAYATRPASSLGAAGAAHSAALWLWFIPFSYQWALATPALYWLMKAALLASAVWFWAAALNPSRRPGGAALGFVFIAAQLAFLGAFIVAAETPLYPVHMTTTGAWAMTPLDDQQLGGLLLLSLGAGAYLIAALYQGARWLDRREEPPLPLPQSG